MSLISTLKLRAVILVAIVAWAGGLALGGVVFYRPPVEHISHQHTLGELLVEAHHCWTGDAPRDMEHKLPGHVVVTLPSGTSIYGGPHYVGEALDQQFGGKPAGLQILGFCR